MNYALEETKDVKRYTPIVEFSYIIASEAIEPHRYKYVGQSVR